MKTRTPARFLTPAVLWRAGWALWLGSLVTPDSRGHHLGVVWLGYAPWQGAKLLVQGLASSGGGASVLLGAALLAGFAANFTALLRAGAVSLALALALPWLPYLAYVYFWHSGRLAPEASPATLLYFYPWALGLGAIQVAKAWHLRQPRARVPVGR